MKEVWIVDDDEEMGHAIGLMLQLLDYSPKNFMNPRPAAQALLAGKRPELLILDINMPEVSGLDMLEFLRRRREWKDLPIIMLSSEAADVMVEKALQLGADGYVMKPVTIDEL
ncbi:MAG: response regulator, partial [Anaerolineales bacterium]|nr:response regulator [Anaerolineales bacterium]